MTFHPADELAIPALFPGEEEDTLYVESHTWLGPDRPVVIAIGHDTVLDANVILPDLPEPGDTLRVTDSSAITAWVGRGLASVEREAEIVGIPYVDSGYEAWAAANLEGHRIKGRWAVRYRLTWKDMSGRPNRVAGRAYILMTRFRGHGHIFD